MRTLFFYLQISLFISACSPQNKKAEETNLSTDNSMVQDTTWTDKVIKLVSSAFLFCGLQAEINREICK